MVLTYLLSYMPVNTRVSCKTDFHDVELKSVVSPRREQHGAVLFVKRKVADVDGARASEDDHRQDDRGGEERMTRPDDHRQPRDIAVRRHDDVRTNR